MPHIEYDRDFYSDEGGLFEYFMRSILNTEGCYPLLEEFRRWSAPEQDTKAP